jgi:hypothetical protein
MQKNAHIPTPTPNTRDRAIGAIKRTYDNAFHDWEQSDLHDWLVVSVFHALVTVRGAGY